MSRLSLKVGGRSYTVSCADGEEDHIRELAGMLDERIARLGSAVPAGDPQGLLFAGLFLADELAEAKKSTGRSAGPDDASGPSSDDATAEMLEKVALRLELLATALEGSRAAS